MFGAFKKTGLFFGLLSIAIPLLPKVMVMTTQAIFMFFPLFILSCLSCVLLLNPLSINMISISGSLSYYWITHK